MKPLLTILFLLIAGCAYGETYTLDQWADAIRLAEIDLEIIKQIESGGNPHAYNKHSGATGLYQITPICLEDFNMFSHLRPRHQGILYDYAIDAMYDPMLNYRVASWYMNTRIPQLLKHYGIEDTLDHRLAAYNWGARKLRDHLRGEIKMPKETKNYIRDYKRLQ